MSRRKQWKPSAPELVRFKKVGNDWEYYFPGWRSVPAMRWTVERKKYGRSAAYYVRNPIGEQSAPLHTLAEAREYISRHYAYLPAT